MAMSLGSWTLIRWYESHQPHASQTNILFQLVAGHEDLGHRHRIRGAKPSWWSQHRPSSPRSPSTLEAGESPPRTESPPRGHHHDLGIQAVLIHILGDALNNVGVIIAAAVIWKASSEKRFYADPAMSLVIGIMLILTAWKLSKFPFSSW